MVLEYRQKKLIVLSIVFVIVFIVVVGAFYFLLPSRQPEQNMQPTPTPITVLPSSEPNKIPLTIDNNGFNYGSITLEKGKKSIIEIENTDSKMHNFMVYEIVSKKGMVKYAEVFIPPKSKKSVELRFDEEKELEFVCFVECPKEWNRKGQIFVR